MIKIQDNIIELHTNDTSYILSTQKGALPENLYYGSKITLANPAPLQIKAEAGYGGDIRQTENETALSSLCLDLSSGNRGDYRSSSLLVQMPHGSTTTQFSFGTAQQQNSLAPSGGMPQGHSSDGTLCLSFSDPSGLLVELFYTVFSQSNVITKKMRITNHTTGQIQLLRALSQQLDIPRSNFTLYTLTGAWAREFNLTKRPLTQGMHRFQNNTGASGNSCNPFFFIAENNATESTGDVYGFNLVYSGSHEGSVEVDAFGRTRILQGILSDGFSWSLAPGDSFITPEAVLTFSDKGKTGMSHNMHHFIQNHIIPFQWKNKPRPVLVNNWEGTYFRFNEAKLMGMARTAAKLGVELFVLDDGWFGRRENDKAGLGDYDVNRKKLPSGLKGLAQKIKNLGMDFGLWFEPEMVNANSKLFEDHPDWIIRTPGYPPCTGRHQYVLDLCRPEVRQYIIQSMGKTLDSAPISYVKWDMNRHISDNYSSTLKNQGEFLHRYTLGLYELFNGICATRENILFEGCSSGGNRFDLGILAYMPQIWTSDNTDAYQRQKIQTGVSYGYPACTTGCHVSAVPNHQTLRKTPLETRFNTAAFGLLGYELDMRYLTSTEKSDIKNQIAFYKKHRMLLQYGLFYRLENPFETSSCRWMMVSPNQNEGIVGDFIHLIQPNSTATPMRLTGLQPDALYRCCVRPQKISIDQFGGLINYILPIPINPDGVLAKTANKVVRMDTETEVYEAYGDLLCKAGINRLQNFSGAGYHEEMRLLTDFSSRIYYLCKT